MNDFVSGTAKQTLDEMDRLNKEEEQKQLEYMREKERLAVLEEEERKKQDRENKIQMRKYLQMQIEEKNKMKEFERLMELEGYTFTKPELAAIFKYIDFKGDNSIDREEWNKTMNKIPHPIVTIQNYIRNKKYDKKLKNASTI